MKALAIVLFAFIGSAIALSNYARPKQNYDAPKNHYVGERVYLSKLLESHGAEFAKNTSKVIGIGNYTSYAGFITTDAAKDNNMFLWYFPAQNGNPNAPLLIWLQGGPGASSLFGLFVENGPLELTEDLQVYARNTTWNANYSMIFIDNPVGAGYSYTGTNQYCQNETCVANNLYSLMFQFYQVFPEEIMNDLYITGESYGGHYIPAFGYKIYVENQGKPQLYMNLKGVAIGDGWVDPINMVPAYTNLMYNIGTADENQQRRIQEYCDAIVDQIIAEEWYDSFTIWDEFLNGDIYPYPTYYHNISGSNDYDNLMYTNEPADYNWYAEYVTEPQVRAAIHVGDATFWNGSTCEMNLLNDFMKSYKPELTVLMNNYKVLIYSGQLDIIIGAPLTEAFLPTVAWDGQMDYIRAPRGVWYIPNNTDVAGYVRTVMNFRQIIVRGAGHIVPNDQPDRALDMITRFIENIPYY